jgi:modulator of FtsH protease HflC
MDKYFRYALWQVGEALVLLALISAYNLMSFTVSETDRVVVLRFGKPLYEITEPGWYPKAPWLRVRYLDKRLIKHDAEPREIIIADKKTMMVDLFSYFRIVDGMRFLDRTRTMENAQSRMDDTTYSALRNDLGNRDFDDILVKDRLTVMTTVTASSRKQLQEYGLTTNLVRMSRTELPQQNKESVYSRMIAERRQQADQYRSEGDELAVGIKAATDRETKTMMAEANALAQKTWGEGEAEAARIYNEAYGRDPEFFRIYRGLLAARATMENGDVRFVLKGNEPHLKAVFGR